MVMAREKSDYESLRVARISENKARLESLGIHRSSTELRAIISSSAKSNKNPRTPPKPYTHRYHNATPTRRSSRLATISSKSGLPAPRGLLLDEEADSDSEMKGGKRRSLPLSRPPSACTARGSIYDPIYGITCHFCRQKKLCGEEDCRRCGDRDLSEPCIGKTQCSVCRSGNGILCRACLLVRYGEEMEEVRSNKDWMCPHCVEEKGTNPFWICNSSICLKKRTIAPTGIAIYRAREQGYKSVAHLLMDVLKQKSNK